jgi:hypothetical protein
MDGGFQLTDWLYLSDDTRVLRGVVMCGFTLLTLSDLVSLKSFIIIILYYITKYKPKCRGTALMV